MGKALTIEKNIMYNDKRWKRLHRLGVYGAYKN